jgi:hypothetical protein
MNRRDLFKAISAPALVQAIDQIQSVDRIPGDSNVVLLVTVKGHISHDQIAGLRDVFEKVMPGRKVIIVEDAISVKLIPSK